ncbi:hypothetical protein J7K50_05935 [bacterium]|nr:hypothetical protein [bacterium]
MRASLFLAIFACLLIWTNAAWPAEFAVQIDIEGLAEGVYVIDELSGSATKLTEVSIDRSEEPRELLITMPKTDNHPLIVGRFDEHTYERTSSGYVLVKLSPSLNPRIANIETGFGSQFRFFNDPAQGSIAAFIIGWPEKLPTVTPNEYLKMLFRSPESESADNEPSVSLGALPIVSRQNSALRIDFCMPHRMAQVQEPTQVLLEINTDLGLKSFAFTVGEEGLYIFESGQFPQPVYALSTWKNMKNDPWWSATFEPDAISFVTEGGDWEGAIEIRDSTDLRCVLADDSEMDRIRAMPIEHVRLANGSGIKADLSSAETLSVTKIARGTYSVDWRGLYYSSPYKLGIREWILSNDAVLWAPIMLG